jgi:hypothetical protein
MKKTQTRLNLKIIATIYILFYGLFAIGNRLVSFLCLMVVKFDCPASWPISIFILRAPPQLYYPKLEHIGLAILTIFFLIAGLFLAQKTHYNLWVISLLAILSIVGSNLIQGWNFGFIRPIVGPDEYYSDAIKIINPGDFFSGFMRLQPYLLMHSRSHPPGAVLLIYYLVRYLGSPAVASVAIAIFSTIITSVFFYRLLKSEKTKELSGFLTLLLLLVPSIQIYFLASIDAVASSMLIASVSLFITSKSKLGTVLSALFLFIASFLDFGFLFAIPVIVAVEWLWTRKITRSVIVVLILVVFYFLIYSISGFNYLGAFRQASQIENPNGFLLFSNPLNYIMTRIEDIAEIIFFLGPFLTYFGILSFITHGFEKRFVQIASLGIGSLLLMFATGAFRTGETARSAIFIYPYLLLLAGESVTDRDISPQEQTMIFLLVFTPGILMQLVGNYFW